MGLNKKREQGRRGGEAKEREISRKEKKRKTLKNAEKNDFRWSNWTEPDFVGQYTNNLHFFLSLEQELLSLSESLCFFFFSLLISVPRFSPLLPSYFSSFFLFLVGGFLGSRSVFKGSK